MNCYVRYFVSQYFGKATVTVQPEGPDGGRVRIDATAPTDGSIAYAISTARLETALRDLDSWPETVARAAIQQAQMHFADRGEKGLFNTTHVLAEGIKPWTGDLSRVPFNRSLQGHADQDAAGRLRTALSGDSSGS